MEKAEQYLGIAVKVAVLVMVAVYLHQTFSTRCMRCRKEPLKVA